MSLLQAAATPVGISAVFALHSETPLTANGSGIGTVEVSVIPTRLTSMPAGGLIVTRRCEFEIEGINRIIYVGRIEVYSDHSRCQFLQDKKTKYRETWRGSRGNSERRKLHGESGPGLSISLSVPRNMTHSPNIAMQGIQCSK